MDTVLNVNNVSKSFKDKLVLDNLQIQCNYGENILIYGPNGSGKSVFLNSILGFVSIDTGSIYLLGKNIDDREFLRRNSTVVSIDHQNFMEFLTPREFFSFIIDVYKLSPLIKLQEAKELALLLKIEDKFDTTIVNLSFGSKKKIQLIGSLLINPILMVCDEIFEGVDEESVYKIIDLLNQRKSNGKLTIISTHLRGYGNLVSTKSYILEEKKIKLLGDILET